MAGASCAKIIIDNYGNLGSAGTGIAVTGESSCEALMQLVEAGVPWEEIEPITNKACYWGDEIRKWDVELQKEVRELAEKYLANPPAKKPKD